ncbi:methylated-DNA--[protein]-cysteine S-methyltransferase [Celeribacter litoreus]|uniref:methylated-DNA--[protein]-cysteine S-methyltransferase n=1 Tax=Celeribacter litoreus TaxID=2876714 RepID=UPI001CCA18EA|nr:bifunctional helix-turn-helix domain-containing protein/methylated-DNA--[protein]-cysteine S-methyltransferase [Celeribacter litoreus]MCA0044491.1 bifunctional helix-turn-helix domain-containing protein/methylated-DNA--[protein]-cysteine S-methyltransferase [Celeribacter litoreus]
MQTNNTQLEDRYHYQVVRRAIELIDDAEHALSLEDLASALGMDAFHLQKLFSQWAGVSPKRFQQYLTLGHAKRLMQENHTTLDTALATGLSGTGRLHDLFMRWEAMTPGEYARRGADLTISYGWFDTPFGPGLAMATDRGLCALGFLSDGSHEETYQDLASRWPNATFVEAPDQVRPYVEAALGGGEVTLHMLGAPFQIKVWEALLSIPSGSVSTYSDIAAHIGSPKAVRAVGTAVGRNPVSWLIPCHRVLRKTGELGGYHWGLPVKRALLAYESVRAAEES